MENIEISFSTYAIDFGKSLDDAARGYWVKGLQKSGDDVWYKMEKSDKKYLKYSKLMEYKVDKFLALHDTLTKGKYKFVTTNPMNGLVSCKLSIKDFYNGTNQAFDFSFVEENCEFVLDHLKNNVDSVKSIKFLESIVKLGNIQKKDFLLLFPRLKAYYRKEENEIRKIQEDNKLIEIEKKAKFEDEISRDEFRKKKKEREFQVSCGSEIDQRKKVMKINDLQNPFTVGLVSNTVKKPNRDNPLDYYHNDSRRDNLTLPQKVNKKKSYIDQIDDLTIFKVKEVPLLKEVNTPRTQILTWTDGTSDGRIAERYIINYDEVHEINPTGKILVSCLKKK